MSTPSLKMSTVRMYSSQSSRLERSASSRSMAESLSAPVAAPLSAMQRMPRARSSRASSVASSFLEQNMCVPPMACLLKGRPRLPSRPPLLMGIPLCGQKNATNLGIIMIGVNLHTWRTARMLDTRRNPCIPTSLSLAATTVLVDGRFLRLQRIKRYELRISCLVVWVSRHLGVSIAFRYAILRRPRGLEDRACALRLPSISKNSCAQS